MFLVLDSTDHEHYRNEITIADRADPPMELHTLGELSAICQNCDQKLANLFKSRDDMMRWIAWLTKPEKPAGQSGKVVHLKKPH
jgi:hypothetical protein